MKITLFYDHVTVIDYAYLDDHLGVIGNSLIANVELIGETDDEGILYDFSHAKKKVKEIIDEVADHRLVVPSYIVKKEGNICEFDFKYGLEDDSIFYRCPEEGLCQLPNKHVSIENLKTYLEEEVLKHMPKNVVSVKLQLEREVLPEGKPTFHYTHGLKQHYGNCQRLFHGHRNTVDVSVNTVPSPEMEEHLAHTIFKRVIHFCFNENIVNLEEVKKAFAGEEINGRLDNPSDLKYVHIKYESAQGVFEGKLPSKEVYFMSEETTVENLSMEYAKYIKTLVDPSDVVQVKAYEGIAKGALTTI